MGSDPLSEALGLVGARCTVTGAFTAAHPWSLRFRPRTALKFEALAEGRCLLLHAGAPEPVSLEAGDAVVVNGGEPFVLCSDPDLEPVEAATVFSRPPAPITRLGDRDEIVIVGGHVETDRGGDDLLRAALPRITRVTAGSSEAAETGRLLARILAETTEPSPGGAYVVDTYAQLLLVQVLRAALQSGVIANPGWLSLLSDPDLQPALSLMHGEPGRAWGLADLARAAAMSRSSFAARFKRVAGESPVAYLTRWRMRLAQQRLVETDRTIAELAAELGYASESSFSHAFTRVTGLSPSRYRRAEVTERSLEPVG